MNQPAHRPTRRVLVADDEESVRTMLTRLFLARGHHVAVAASADDAAAALDREKFDLLIVDRRMPVRDGFDLARDALRRQPELAILMITAAPERISADEAALLDGYLSKPFPSLDDFIADVERAILRKAEKRARENAQRTLEGLTAGLGSPRSRP